MVCLALAVPAHEAQNAEDLLIGWQLITRIATEYRVLLQLTLLLVHYEPDIRWLGIVGIVPFVFAVSRQSLLHNSILWAFYSRRNCRY